MRKGAMNGVAGHQVFKDKTKNLVDDLHADVDLFAEGLLVRTIVQKNGPYMDDSEENCIVKWGKMDASKHRFAEEQAIGVKPPYLMILETCITNQPLGSQLSAQTWLAHIVEQHEVYMPNLDFLEENDDEATDLT